MTVSLFVDGTTALNAAALNQFPAVGNGGKTGVHLVYARMRYNGSAWEVQSTTDSAGLISANIAYSTDHINIALSNFSVAPCVLVAPALVNTDAAYWPKVLAASASQVQVAFYNDAGVRQTTQSSNMDVYLLIIGV